MILLKILLAYLVTGTVACAYLSQNNTRNNERRWTAYTSPITTWPPDDSTSGYYTISYCYRDQASWKNFHEELEKGLELWFQPSKLGPPSKMNGHGLRVRDVTGPNPDLQGGTDFCYIGGRWNTKFDGRTVVITWTNDGDGARATPGYTKDGEEGRHELDVRTWEQDVPVTDLTATFAHEFGHIFGLAHEHQRLDRDTYVDLKCENIVGYEDAQAKLAANNPHQYTIDQVCADSNLATEYEWTHALDFTKIETKPVAGVDASTDIRVQSGPFDVYSIMLYDSWTYNKNANSRDVNDLTLVKWKESSDAPNKQRSETNCEYIGTNTEVSAGDMAMIRQYYRWYGS